MGGHTTDLHMQGFSQDFRIGCPKIHICGELGVQFLFIPLHYTQKIWILGCPKSAIGCPKDTQTPLWLKACTHGNCFLLKGIHGNFWQWHKVLNQFFVHCELCLWRGRSCSTVHVHWSSKENYNFLEWCPLKSTASKWMIFGLMLATVVLITHVKKQRNQMCQKWDKCLQITTSPISKSQKLLPFHRTDFRTFQ